MDIIENTNFIKYIDNEIVKNLEKMKDSKFLQFLGSELMRDNHESFRKLEFILGDKIEWDAESLTKNVEDFQHMKMGHVNDYEHSLEDVFANYKKVLRESDEESNKYIEDDKLEEPTKVYNVNSALIRKNKWNFVVEQDVYYKQRVNLKFFNMPECISNELDHVTAERIIDNIAELLDKPEIDLIVKKVHTKDTIIIYSVKEGRYLAYIKGKDNKGKYFFDYTFENIIVSILESR